MTYFHQYLNLFFQNVHYYTPCKLHLWRVYCFYVFRAYMHPSIHSSVMFCYVPPTEGRGNVLLCPPHPPPPPSTEGRGIIVFAADPVSIRICLCNDSAYGGRSTPTTAFDGAISYFAFTMLLCRLIEHMREGVWFKKIK